MKNRWMTYVIVAAVSTHLSPYAVAQTGTTVVAPLVSQTAWNFSFGDKAAKGVLQVLPTTVYTPELGYGLEPGSEVRGENGSFTSNRAFRFSAAVPEGNYRVTVVLGDKIGASNTSVKAEARRLMLENISTSNGQTTERTFSVNIRSPHIASGGSVRLTGREAGPPPVAHWDEKLTLEFSGSRPCVSNLSIVPEQEIPTIFLAGDSTVTDQFLEPWAAWGQMLPRFFKPGIAVANYAESGLTLDSFRYQKRLEKILSLAKAGDFVFIQFGHNDQKDKRAGAGPFTTYKTDLQDYITQIRGRGATPVLVTPMERRRYEGGQFHPTLSDYAEAVRQVGTEARVPVIDLNATSLKFYAALGGENSKRAFVYAGPGDFPGLNTVIKDNTHFSDYGAYQLARIVVDGIHVQVPTLKPFLVEGITAFDPANPDPFDSFAVPPSRYQTGEKPAGS